MNVQKQGNIVCNIALKVVCSECSNCYFLKIQENWLAIFVQQLKKWHKIGREKKTNNGALNKQELSIIIQHLKLNIFAV